VRWSLGSSELDTACVEIRVLQAGPALVFPDLQLDTCTGLYMPKTCPCCPGPGLGPGLEALFLVTACYLAGTVQPRGALTRR
jgi:hypothetical protein